MKLASDSEGGGATKGKFVCQIVGDGSYMFSVPSSVYWISQRYRIPVLTVVLNNNGDFLIQYELLQIGKELTANAGWNAPRKSLLFVHPHGEGSKASNEELNISMSPTPDFAGIARAASGGKAWARSASTVDDLKVLLPEAVAMVSSGCTAVLDSQLDGAEGKFQG